MYRILVIRLSSIGDIVHTLPAVAALKQSLRDAEIAWVVEKRYAGLLERNPFLQRVIQLDTLGWRACWRSPATVRDVMSGLGEVRSFRADLALDFQGLIKSAVLGRLSSAPRRIGFGGQWLRESPARVFYSEGVVEARGRRHVVEENLALAERAGAQAVAREHWHFPLLVSPEVERRVDERLWRLGIERFLVVNPGGGWMSKRWPPQQYAQLVNILDREKRTVLITGSPAEEPAIHHILDRAEARRAMYFPSTVAEYIALIRRASLFVGGDTGPLHLAAAVGTPIVAIYGPTNPERNGPFAPSDITIWSQRPLAGPGSGPSSQTHWHAKEGKNSAYIEDLPTEAVRAAIEQRLAAADGA